MEESMNRPLRLAGINFDHFHMGDLLRMAHEHPGVEIVGLSDMQPERMQPAAANFNIPKELCFEDPEACLEATRPDLVVLCPAAAEHAEWTERVAPHGVHILMEKPFAGSLAEADRMIRAMEGTGKILAINWPLRWVASHVATYQCIQEGRIGEVLEVHFYDGNRGPLYHGADKIEKEPTAAEKASSWFYHRERGGGSLQDYLGYGTTLGTWFMDGRKPLEMGCMTHSTPGLEVDEHSITVARYAHGLSSFQTRWGTFTDPWTHQPQPKCGFVIRGSEGTLSSYDYEPTIRLQDRQHPEGIDLPAPPLQAPKVNPIQYLVDRLERGLPVEGPLSLDICRIGQQMVDTAALSAREGRFLPLLES